MTRRLRIVLSVVTVVLTLAAATLGVIAIWTVDRTTQGKLGNTAGVVMVGAAITFFAALFSG